MTYNDEIYQILIRTYNQENLICDLLRSIRFQILNFGIEKKIHLVILNDASNDGTLSVIREWIEHNNNLFQEIRLIDNTHNQGFTKTYMQILSLVNHKRYLVLDGDDLLYKNNVFDFMEFAAENQVTLSPVIIDYIDYGFIPNIAFLRLFLLKIKIKFRSSKKPYDLKSNYISFPGSNISIDILKNSGLIHHINLDKTKQADHATWEFLINFITNINLYYKPIIIYRPTNIQTYRKNKLVYIVFYILKCIAIFSISSSYKRGNLLSQFKISSKDILSYYRQIGVVE